MSETQRNARRDVIKSRPGYSLSVDIVEDGAGKKLEPDDFLLILPSAREFHFGPNRSDPEFLYAHLVNLEARNAELEQQAADEFLQTKEAATEQAIHDLAQNALKLQAQMQEKRAHGKPLT